jgi:iron complex transport system permease protein
MRDRARPRFALLAAACALVVCLAPFLGLRCIGPWELASTAFEHTVFFSVRLPRVVLGFLAGGGLAVCGMVFQAMFRNPLATPYTLGVSSGASFGAAVAILSGAAGSVLGLPVTSIGSFAGAAAAMGIVYGFSRIPRVASSMTILLAGVAVSFMFSSMLMFAQFLSDARLSFAIVRWLMGGLDVYGFRTVWSMLPLYVVGLTAVACKLPELDHLLTGEDLAATRGVNVARTKTILYFATSLTVSAIVAVCGPIGFVGMMAPHVCRCMFTNDHRVLGPATFLLGGGFLVACDILSRTLVAPTEIPVGVITALCGGPFFLWVLLGRVRAGGTVLG